MNYDKYGFPIFDDEWDDAQAFPQERPVIKESEKENRADKSEHEDKPKNTGLF